MAYINLKNVVVARVFHNGLGLGVEERFRRNDGSEGKAKYSVWFDSPHGIAIGSTIEKVGGVLSVKAKIVPSEQGEDYAAADVSINQPKVEGVSGGGASAPADNPFGSDDSPF